jgi:D-threo-aldose 1-dehydrogenase
MRHINIRGTDIHTSQIGFGCASLTSLNDRARALELLHAAFESGITHFDVARLYGFGHAEGIVGEFISGRRDRVTVATKFGLTPPTGLIAGHAGIVSVARSVVRRFPLIGGFIRRRARDMVSVGNFSAAAARRSLEKSLSELRTDYVDLLLLHEGTLVDACQDELRHFLNDQVARGTVRHTGIATAADGLEGDLSLFPSEYKVFQFEDNIIDRRLDQMRGVDMAGIVTHSALRPLAALQSLIVHHRVLTKRWSERLGVDLSANLVLAQLLIAWSLSRNQSGVVLFGSTKVANVKSNVGGYASTPLDTQLLAGFVKFVGELSSDRQSTK